MIYISVLENYELDNQINSLMNEIIEESGVGEKFINEDAKEVLANIKDKIVWVINKIKELIQKIIEKIKAAKTKIRFKIIQYKIQKGKIKVRSATPEEKAAISKALIEKLIKDSKRLQQQNNVNESTLLESRFDNKIIDIDALNKININEFNFISYDLNKQDLDRIIEVSDYIINAIEKIINGTKVELLNKKDERLETEPLVTFKILKAKQDIDFYEWEKISNHLKSESEYFEKSVIKLEKNKNKLDSYIKDVEKAEEIENVLLQIGKASSIFSNLMNKITVSKIAIDNIIAIYERNLSIVERAFKDKE